MWLVILTQPESFTHNQNNFYFGLLKIFLCLWQGINFTRYFWVIGHPLQILTQVCLLLLGFTPFFFCGANLRNQLGSCVELLLTEYKKQVFIRQSARWLQDSTRYTPFALLWWEYILGRYDFCLSIKDDFQFSFKDILIINVFFI